MEFSLVGIVMALLALSPLLMPVYRRHKLRQRLSENPVVFLSVGPQGRQPGAGWSIVAVVGEGQENPDGVSRQRIIRKLRAGDAVELVHDLGNQYDPFAVAVITAYGQIGFIGRHDDARESILGYMHSGRRPLRARVLDIHGGTRDKPMRGVTIEVDIDTREFYGAD